MKAEYLHSFAANAAQGDPELLDRCERVAYNALPGTLSEDMWAHQYLQQANGVAAARAEPHVWVTDGAESTVFGVEPNFGCCTANFNQARDLAQQEIASGVGAAFVVAVRAMRCVPARLSRIFVRKRLLDG